MREVAKVYCCGDHVNTTNCEWYHANWKRLKKLNMVSNPLWHKEFYKENLRKFTKESSTVMISGAADDGMLDLIYETNSKNNIVMIDLCMTPLMICKKYASKNRLDVELVRCDARYIPIRDRSISLITTDAFLTRFDENDKRNVVSEWKRILRNKGYVVTTARVEDHGFVVPSLMDSVRYTLRALIKSFLTLSNPLKNIRSAWTYIKRITSHPFKDKNSIEELFKEFSNIDINISAEEFIEDRRKKYARIIVEIGR
jgi:ubiquinone/menaquinone biosynthesis C-methylase UbiE